MEDKKKLTLKICSILIFKVKLGGKLWKTKKN